MSNPTDSVPDWLRHDTINDGTTTTTADVANGGGGHSTYDLELHENGTVPASTATLSSVELDGPAPAKNRRSSSASASPSSAKDSGNLSKCGRCLKWTNALISLFFFGLFVASATFQNNDTGASAIAYLLFYALHAVVAGVFLLAHCCCTARLQRGARNLAFAMMGWSFVWVIITSKRYADATAGGPDAGGDNPDLTDKQEKAYEVAGVTLGLVSTLYHIAVGKLCCMNKSGSSNSSSEEAKE